MPEFSDTCPHCTGSRLIPVGVTAQGLAIVRCDHCGHRFTLLPSALEIAADSAAAMCAARRQPPTAEYARPVRRPAR